MYRLKEKYQKEIAPKIKEEMGLSSVMAVPRLQKIVINAGIGSFKDNKEAIDSFVEELKQITGQMPKAAKARLAISNFKIKKNDIIGYFVTLRGERMWAFLDKFINIAVPRMRDFTGLSSTSFDDAGNYSCGVREHVIFPEVNPNTTKGNRSLQITIVTTSKDKELNKKLLNYLGMPFKKGK